ncbi:hypothetical protein [Staphylococcus saprophyticus]|uniref:hypothetical protein n=1 Tax=Staphylococcus saprophyticus TaxID=29385 RepID=UPI0011BD0EC7|nr:hypothetical protein [Staphylococcus saprophyticus]
MRTKENPEMPMVPKAHLKTVEHQRDQFKAERDNCLKDIEQLRERNRELYQENENLRNDLEGVETYLDAIKTYYPMYESLRKQYTTLTNHIRLKAEANPGVSRYLDLVNYIDRLEQE